MYFESFSGYKLVTSNFAKKREKMKIGTWNLERLKHYK